MTTFLPQGPVVPSELSQVCLFAAMLGLPQLAFAVAGGVLTRAFPAMSRFRIGWLMAVIIILIVVNIGMIRPWYEDDSKLELLLGSLPMGNVLAVGVLVAGRQLGSRPFFLGFEVVGALALAVYVAVTIRYPAWLWPYLQPVLRPLVEPMGSQLTPARLLLFCCVTAAMLGLPQLAIALVGGILFRRFRTAGRSEQTGCGEVS